ncbi:hypothetical protein JHK85_034698 [Glycine max]|nr:hypothetical protein JHK85_034698 [Glycine max]
MSSSHASFMLMCMQDIVIIQGIVGLAGMRFALNAFVNNHSIFAMRAWSWWRASLSVMVLEEGLEFSRGGSCQRLDCVLIVSMGGRGGIFIASPQWAPNVLTKFDAQVSIFFRCFILNYYCGVNLNNLYLNVANHSPAATCRH